MLNSFSVIIPVLNKENEIVRTLTSVDASITYFLNHHDPAHTVQPEVVIVNEGSSDRSLERINQFCQDKPYFKVISHSRRMSAGTARNTGVKISSGDAIFFCDGDDLFFEEHIYLCFQFLNHNPQAATETSFKVTTKAGAISLNFPDQAVGIVRTGMHMDDPIHPYWKLAIENASPQNLCIRRDCHDFVEGYPEERVPYNQTGCEDISYQTWIGKFFKTLKVNIDTVEYIRYPGNNLDRQLKKFQTPPEQYQEHTPPDILKLHGIRQKLEQQRLGYLFEKFRHIDQSPEFLAVLNWQQLGMEYLSHHCFAEAIALLECWLNAAPDNPEARNLLAAAYNNFGSHLKAQGERRQAIQAFKQAIDLHPSLTQSDLARVYFNLAMELKDQGESEQALHFLDQSTQLDANFAEGILEHARLSYQTQIIWKGYKFTTPLLDDVAIWQRYLNRYANLPDLSFLATNSRDGQVACWLLDNVLTHRSTQLTCLSQWLDNEDCTTQRFDYNISKTGCPEKIKKITGNPAMALRSLPANSYQVAWVGAAADSDIVEQTILLWALMQVGGILMVAQPTPGSQESPAIEAFLNTFHTRLRLLHRGSCLVLEKISG